MHVSNQVSQRSALHLVLFIVYVNDMTEVIDSEVSLFADDLKLMWKIQADEDQVRLRGIWT